MVADKYNFVVEQGATVLKTITWSDNNITSTAVTLAMQVRQRPSSTIIASSTGVITITKTVPASGTFTVGILSTDTAALTAGIYKYDLEITGSTGYVTRLLEGDFTIMTEITT